MAPTSRGLENRVDQQRRKLSTGAWTTAVPLTSNPSALGPSGSAGPPRPRSNCPSAMVALYIATVTVGSLSGEIGTLPGSMSSPARTSPEKFCFLTKQRGVDNVLDYQCGNA